MFIKEAFAQTAENAVGLASSAGEGSVFSSMVPLFLVLFVFYFLVIRPQNKRVKEHQEMIRAIKKGDKIVTSGGIVGKVKKVVNDDEVVVEIADGVDIHLMRSGIMSLKGAEITTTTTTEN